MDQDTIQKIAQEVGKHPPDYLWQLLAAQVMLTLFAFGGGALVGAYLRKNFATKPDLDDQQDQLPGDTKMVETVKSEIDHENWRKREWANLRRIKLEALLSKVHDCDHYFDQLPDTTFESALLEGRDPLSELEVIATLYFPELKADVDQYLDLCRVRKAEGLARTAMAEVKRADFETVREKLSTAARNLTTEIMGVAESLPSSVAQTSVYTGPPYQGRGRPFADPEAPSCPARGDPTG